MKHNISIRVYIVFTILFLTIPILGRIGMYINGVKTTGVVIKVETTVTRTDFYTSTSKYSIIEYKAGAKSYKALGPQNKVYDVGNEITLLYHKKKPAKTILLTFAGMYINGWIALTIVAIMIWSAYYFSFKKNDDKIKI